MSENSGSGIIIHPDDKHDDTCDEADEIEIEPVVSNKKTRRIPSYILVKYIEEIDIELTDKAIQENDFTTHSRWSKNTSKLTNIGQTIFYACLFKSCSAKLQLIIDTTLNCGTIQMTDDGHVHDEEERQVDHGLSESVKEMILKFDKMHLKVVEIYINNIYNG